MKDGSTITGSIGLDANSAGKPGSPSGYTWFSHPVLDGIGGLSTSVDKYAANGLRDLPTTSLISESAKSLDGLQAGARFVGPGTTIAAGLLDVASGNDNVPHAVGNGLAALSGGEIGADVGGAIGALVPLPGADIALAGLLAVGGGEVGSWLFDGAWNATS